MGFAVAEADEGVARVIAEALRRLEYDSCLRSKIVMAPKVSLSKVHRVSMEESAAPKSNKKVSS